MEARSCTLSDTLGHHVKAYNREGELTTLLADVLGYSDQSPLHCAWKCVLHYTLEHDIKIICIDIQILEGHTHLANISAIWTASES